VVEVEERAIVLATGAFRGGRRDLGGGHHRARYARQSVKRTSGPTDAHS